jgi:hypothetical protein
MRRSRMFLFPLLVIVLLACAGPKPHRFLFQYTPAQAMRVCRQVLVEQGYETAVFDASAGVLKTKPREFVGEQGGAIRYQIAIAIITRHELRISVIPSAALGYRDQIMELLMDPLKAAGLYPKYIPPPPPRPRYWRRPPPPPLR